MSKIEVALAKARQARGLVETSSNALPGREITISGARGLSRATVDVVKMAQPAPMTNEARNQRKIIWPEMQDTRVANAFRELRTKVLEKTGARNAIVLVTAAGPGHGSSFVALNLAVAFCFDETKTALLMDCNLADPGMSDLTTAAETPGLVDYFESENLRVEEIIHPTGIHRLRLIPTGGKREGARDYFTSRRLGTLLAQVRERYPDRYIVIDAPPILESPDTRILLEQCELALVVAGYAQALPAQIKAACDLVGPGKLLGVTLNGEPDPLSRYGGAGTKGLRNWFSSKKKS